jgi:hypothetical protein
MANKKVTPEKNKKTKIPATGLPAGQRAALRRWNLGLAVILALQAVAIAVFSGKVADPITVRYPAVDTLASTDAHHQLLASSIRHLFDVRVLWATAALLLVLALLHLLLATKARKMYEDRLSERVHSGRWVLSAVCGGALFTLIAWVSGFNDLATLGLVWWSSAVAAILGLAVESLGANRPQLHRLLVVVGAISLALPWLIFIKASLAAVLYGGHMPLYLWTIYVSTLIFLLYVVYGTLMHWHNRGKWANTLYAERMFLVIGAVAASAVAWQLFAGVR